MAGGGGGSGVSIHLGVASRLICGLPHVILLGLNCGLSPRVANAVKLHVRPHPVDILLLGSYAVVLVTGAFTDLIEEPRRLQRRAILGGSLVSGFAVSVITVLNNIRHRARLYVNGFRVRCLIGYLACCRRSPHSRSLLQVRGQHGISE